MTDTFKFGGIEFAQQESEPSLILGSLEFFTALAREHGIDDKCSETWPDNWIMVVPFGDDDDYELVIANQVEWKE